MPRTLKKPRAWPDFTGIPTELLADIRRFLRSASRTAGFGRVLKLLEQLERVRKPRIAVTVNGGRCSHVYSDLPLEIEILDLDTEGLPEDEAAAAEARDEQLEQEFKYVQ